MDDKRKEIDYAKIEMTKLFSTMAEGSIGALTTLMEMYKSDPATATMNILLLDDMNIRGTQIWVGYKDHCEQDMEKFVKAILDKDTNMIKCINEEGLKGNHSHKAVKQGASCRREML